MGKSVPQVAFLQFRGTDRCEIVPREGGNPEIFVIFGLRKPMIVYNDNKRQFVEDVRSGDIAGKILALVRAKGLNAGGKKVLFGGDGV